MLINKKVKKTIETPFTLVLTYIKSIEDGTPSQEDKGILNRQAGNKRKCNFKNNPRRPILIQVIEHFLVNLGVFSFFRVTLSGKFQADMVCWLVSMAGKIANIDH